jgi:hypothetical protein
VYHVIAELFAQVPTRLLLAPEQIAAAERLVGASGIALTVMAMLDELVPDVQPFSTQVAVYVVFSVGVTETEFPVLPSDQVTVPPQPVADNVVDSPTQIVLFVVEIEGAEGVVLYETLIGSELPDSH